MDLLTHYLEYKILDILIFFAVCIACTKSDLILYPVCLAIIIFLSVLTPFGLYNLWSNYDDRWIMAILLSAVICFFGYLIFMVCRLIVVELVGHHKTNGFKVWRK